MVEIRKRPKRRCVRCRMLAQLDRAGYCPLCQYELAYGRVFIFWEALSWLPLTLKPSRT